MFKDEKRALLNWRPKNKFLIKFRNQNSILPLFSWKQHKDKLTHKHKHVFAWNKLNIFFMLIPYVCTFFVLLDITNRESNDKFYARTKIWVKQNIFWYLICKEKKFYRDGK